MRSHIVSFIIIGLAIFVFGCSRGGGRINGGPSDSDKRSLHDTVLNDISQYHVSRNVDPAVVKALSDRLLKDIDDLASGRIPSQAGIAAPPLKLDVSDNGDGTSNFGWKYFCPGDYNLDGEVSIADITPIALNYLKSTSDGIDDNVQEFIDGDGSGEINVADVTPIALNYLYHYRVVAGIYGSIPLSGWTQADWQSNSLVNTFAEITLSGLDSQQAGINLDRQDAHYGWAGITVDLNQAGLNSGAYYFGIRDAAEPCRFASSEFFALTGRNAPVISDAGPVGGATGEPVQFTVQLSSGTFPYTYAWDFGGGASPNTSTDESPSVTLSGAEGTYPSSVTVTNAYGSDTFNWSLVVANKPDIAIVTPDKGATGESVVFNAAVAGVVPLVYSWDFGGGASPNTSTETAPSVTLSNTKGVYPASLTVTNSYGSDTYNWSLDIGNAPSITDVTPISGIVGKAVTFTATLSGDVPLAYLWSFGGGATPDTSIDSRPIETLSAVTGNYAAVLTVSNVYGKVTFPFTLTVNPVNGDGWTLFCPYTGSTDTYLVDMSGALVHTWPSAYPPGADAKLRQNGNLVRMCDVGNPVFGPGKAGRAEEYDLQDNIVWSYDLSTNKRCFHHDFDILPNGNLLLNLWDVITKQEAIDAGRNPAGVSSSGMWLLTVIEVEPVLPSGGNIVWEWKSYDHLIQDYDPAKSNYGDPAAHPELMDFNYGQSPLADWLHVNSVAYNPDLDQITLSVNFISEIWVIDHSTTTAEAAGHTGGRYGHGGDILYRWGNPQVYRAGTAADQKLYMPHNAHWIADGLDGAGDIMIFNNQAGTPAGQQYSSVVEITPPLNPDGSYYMSGGVFGPTDATWEYTSNPKSQFFSVNMSSAQRLPGGNTMICSAQQKTIFEVNPAGDTVWVYFNPFPAGNPGPVFSALRYPYDFPGLAQL